MRRAEKIFRVVTRYKSAEQLLDTDMAKMICYATTLDFLIIHIALLILFSACGVTPMVIFNSFSVLYYLAMIPVIKKGHLRFFVGTAFAEVVLHMSVAVWMTGWGGGFQICLIGINMMLFLAEYSGRVLRVKLLPSLQMSMVSMAMYILSYMVSRYFPTPYPLPDKVCFWLQIAWAIIVFIITITCLQSFVWLASSTEKSLSLQANNDRLTGLGNRNYMNSYLKLLESEEGFDGHWIAMMDIDDFKSINDTCGHLYGDYVLRTIADIMMKKNVDADICRYGGEEFLLTGSTDNNIDIHVARLEDIRKTIDEYDFEYEGTHAHVTVTIGVAEYRPGQSLEAWIGAADKKLYEGKTSGKNKVVI